MNHAIVDPKLQSCKSAIAQLLSQVERFARGLDNGPLLKTIENLQENISQPFLFVVIGEVKAGKSSFINALLGSGEICEVGADPRTNMVAKIIYAEGEGYSRESKPGELREIGRPVPILQQIAIVDTPGTNSPVQQHEDITKEFIPNSDLVIFVFFSKNPYTNTAWSLVDFAHREWRKPVIFVLQQADLADERELLASRQYIEAEAQKRQIPTPKVFATSAKQAMQGGDGGLVPIQDFVRDTITGGKGYKLKLSSNITATEQIVERLARDTQLLKSQLEIDETVVAAIRERLGQGESRSRYEIDSLVERLMAQYERTITQIKREFNEELSLLVLARRSFMSMFNRKERVEVWINDLKKRAQSELEVSLDTTAKEGARRFIEGIQQMIKQLLAELTILQNDALKNTDIALPMLEYRYEVIENVKSKVSGLLEDETFIDCLADTADSVGPGVAKGGILAVIGSVIVGVARPLILDIIGGAFLGLGVLWAGGTLFSKRQGLIKKLDDELERNRARFEATITDQLNTRLSGIYDEIGLSFVELYNYVEKERNSIVPMVKQLEAIQQTTQSLSREISQL
jgi:GTPase SAR1 family protein